ncbi:MAG: CDP-archaeol synthase, partial [Candidatus Korarchaeota archaeon]|nr:CDP-archaeol synthase [Candidatus Korarchaeota archaeon]
MLDLTILILKSLWYILPAYMANMSPVIFGGGRPLDMGKKFLDGRRILGDHKTIKGFASGILIGTLVGCLQGRSLT